MGTALVMCLTEVPVSGIWLLSGIIRHPADNTLSPKERNENKEQWELSRSHWAICMMVLNCLTETQNDTRFACFEYAHILLAVLHILKDICTFCFPKVLSVILRLHIMDNRITILWQINATCYYLYINIHIFIHI